MEKLKVMTIVGTRPEIIRLSECIKACDQYFDHILVHTGQNWNYELNEIFFQDLGLRKPDYNLNVVGNNLGETLGSIISKSYNVMQKEQPDAILILGDTNSALSALSAKRLKIPIFHMEAGNRCFDENVPEEINRKIIDHISDINLPYTEHSRRYLINEGIEQKYIYVIGSPLHEVLNKNQKKIEKSNILNTLQLQQKQYFIASTHREENIENYTNCKNLIDALNRVAEQFKIPIVYSLHPRTEKILNSRNIVLHPFIKILKPFGFFDYIKLQKESLCVLSDSGTLSEESSMLNFPAVLLRTSTERPEVLDKGQMIIAGIQSDNIISSIKLATSIGPISNQIEDYKDINTSIKIIKLIQSYTNIINMNIWHKV